MRTICRARHHVHPDHTEQVWARAKQEHDSGLETHRFENDLDEIRKRIDWGRAAHEHQSVDPQLPVQAASPDLCGCELLRQRVAAVALYAVQDDLKFLLGEAVAFA